MSKLWHNQNSSMFHVPVPSRNSDAPLPTLFMNTTTATSKQPDRRHISDSQKFGSRIDKMCIWICTRRRRNDVCDTTYISHSRSGLLEDNCNVANILAVSGPLCPHGSLTVLHLRSGHRGARVLDESCHSSCSHSLWTTQRMIHFRLMWYRYYWDILEFHCPCFLSSLNGQWKTWSSLKFLLHVFFYLILKIKFGTKLAKVVFRKKTPKFSDS